MTNDKMRECGQACACCGKYLGMATGKLRLCKKCKKESKYIEEAKNDD